MMVKPLQDSRNLRETAIKLVRCVGARAALEYCQNQQWLGLYHEVQALSSGADRRYQ